MTLNDMIHLKKDGESLAQASDTAYWPNAYIADFSHDSWQPTFIHACIDLDVDVGKRAFATRHINGFH